MGALISTGFPTGFMPLLAAPDCAFTGALRRAERPTLRARSARRDTTARFFMGHLRTPGIVPAKPNSLCDGKHTSSLGHWESSPSAQARLSPWICFGRLDLAVAAGFVAAHAGHVISHSAQAAAQTLGELMPRAPQASLQRVFRHTQLLRRFAR